MEDSTLVYVGTYTEPIQFGTGEIIDSRGAGIYVYDLDRASGELTLRHTISGVANPSYLTLGPDKRFLYAVNELKEIDGEASGTVSAFSLEPQTGKLKFLNKQLTHGTDPCHVTVNSSGSHILVANYSSGSVCVLPILQDGSLGEASDMKQHVGSSINLKRQAGPHAHSVWLDDENSTAFVPDLGLDEVVAYEFDPQQGSLYVCEASSVEGRPGAGPRHMDVHPNKKYAYLINELDSSVDAFEYDSAAGIFTSIQTISTLPKEFHGDNSCADIHVSPSGRFLYGSNRGHDSIVIYRIDQETGMLDYVGHASTQGHTPRNFAIDPSGQFLLAANQDSDSVISFRMDSQTGELQPTGFQADIPSPVCIKICS